MNLTLLGRGGISEHQKLTQPSFSKDQKQYISFCVTCKNCRRNTLHVAARRLLSVYTFRIVSVHLLAHLLFFWIVKAEFVSYKSFHKLHVGANFVGGRRLGRGQEVRTFSHWKFQCHIKMIKTLNIFPNQQRLKDVSLLILPECMSHII